MNRRVILICVLGLLTMWVQPFLSAIGFDWPHKSSPPVRSPKPIGLHGYYDNDSTVFYVEGRPAELQDFYEAYTSQLLPACAARDSRIRYMTQTNERMRCGAVSQGMLFKVINEDITSDDRYTAAVTYAIRATRCTIVKSPRIISD